MNVYNKHIMYTSIIMMCTSLYTLMDVHKCIPIHDVCSEYRLHDVNINVYIIFFGAYIVVYIVVYIDVYEFKYFSLHRCIHWLYTSM